MYILIKCLDFFGINIVSMAQIVSTENCNQTSLTYYASLTYEVSKDSRMKIIFSGYKEKGNSMVYKYSSPSIRGSGLGVTGNDFL